MSKIQTKVDYNEADSEFVVYIQSGGGHGENIEHGDPIERFPVMIESLPANSSVQAMQAAKVKAIMEARDKAREAQVRIQRENLKAEDTANQANSPVALLDKG